ARATATTATARFIRFIVSYSRSTCRGRSDGFFECAGRVPDAKLGEVPIQGFFRHRAACFRQRRLGLGEVERGRFLRAIELEGLAVLRLCRGQLLAGQAEGGLGGAEIDEGAADVVPRIQLGGVEVE